MTNRERYLGKYISKAGAETNARERGTKTVRSRDLEGRLLLERGN